MGAGRQPAHPVGSQLPAVRARHRTPYESQTVPRRARARQPRLSAAAAQGHGLRIHRRHRRRAHAGTLQFGVLRARLPGREDRRGARVPRRLGSCRQQAVLPRLCRQPASRGRRVPPTVRRIPRPVRVQPGLGYRRSRTAVGLPFRQRRHHQRARQRGRGRQGDLLFRAADGPLLPQRGADPAQRADLHADVREGPQGSARPHGRAGHQGRGGSRRLRRRVRLVARQGRAGGSGRPHQGGSAPVYRAGGHPVPRHRRDRPGQWRGEPAQVRSARVRGHRAEHARVVFRPDALLVSARPDDRQLVAGRRTSRIRGCWRPKTAARTGSARSRSPR